MNVRTVHGLHLNLHFKNVALNSVANARLKVSIFKATEDNEVSSPGLIPLHETELQPTFESNDRVAWMKEEKTTKRIAYSAEELAGQLIELFVQQIQHFEATKGWEI